MVARHFPEVKVAGSSPVLIVIFFPAHPGVTCSTFPSLPFKVPIEFHNSILFHVHNA